MTRQRDTEREHSIPAVIPLVTVRSHSVAPSPMRWPSSMSAAATSCSSIAPAATKRPMLKEADIELVIASAFLCQGKPLKLSAQRSYCHTLWTRLSSAFGTAQTTLWNKKLNEPMGAGASSSSNGLIQRYR